MDFNVGDFVAIKDEPEQTRLVTSNTTLGTKYAYATNGIMVIYLDVFVKYTVHGVRTWYEKIQPSKKLIERAKANLKNCYNKKAIDNLTYVEICARLKEYEQELI